MEYEKDYSLLRPFNLEAVKRGEKIDLEGGWPTPIEFRGASSTGKVVLIEFVDKSAGERYHTQLRMAPLAWVEGRPVYRGDVLYSTTHKPTGIVVVEDICERDGIIDGSGHYGWPVGTLTWQKPKTKREGWVNVYPNIGCVNIHKTKSEADACATFSDGSIDPNRVACVRIEWEE